MPLETDDTSVYFEDASLIYVRDRHGVLHSPPGYEGREYRRDSTSPTIQPIPKDPMATVHVPTCSVKSGTSLESPCNLYQICKNFIVKNLHLVESLVDFPEPVGYDLFIEALRTQTFHKSPDYLNIFCLAYKSLVLKHLALRQSAVIIDDNQNFLKYFKSLTKLDLGHCRLGDNHEYLQWIGKMKSLECICLKDNCLTDTGILLWTLPHRMHNTGPELLRTLDLSCNPEITDACTKCLVKFSHLKSLNLSGTHVTITSGIRKIIKSTQLKLVSYVPEFSKENFTKTKGWAAPFISELFSKPKPKTRQAQNLNTKRFYDGGSLATAKVNEIKMETSMMKESKVNLNNYPVMLLQSEELVLPNTLRSINNTIEYLEKQSKKRVGDTSGLVSLTSVKRQKMTVHEKNNNVDDKSVQSTIEQLSMADTGILESYLKYLS